MSSYLDFSRWKPLVILGLAMAVTFVFIDLGLNLLLPEGLGHRRRYNTGALRQIGNRVAGAETQALRSNAGVVCLVGRSTVREGFDPVILRERDPLHRNWLVLGGSGGAMGGLDLYAAPLLESRLRPSWVLLGIHRTFFADRVERGAASEVATGFMEGLRSKNPKRMARSAIKISWVRRNYAVAPEAFAYLLFRLRLRWFSGLGYGLPALYRPESDPWKTATKYPGERASPKNLAAQWEAIRKNSASQSFANSELQIAALPELLSSFHRKGARVGVILMPEHSRWRDEYSPEADEALAEALRRSRSRFELPVIDVRNSIPDDLFHDYGHLNSRGRERLSRLLAESGILSEGSALGSEGPTLRDANGQRRLPP